MSDLIVRLLHLPRCKLSPVLLVGVRIVLVIVSSSVRVDLAWRVSHLVHLLLIVSFELAFSPSHGGVGRDLRI